MSKSQGDVIGTIERIWRYPLKSAPGEALGSAALGDLGIPGDRGWALIDRETGYIGGAKLPRSWRSLLRFSARYLAEPRPGSPVPAIELTLPDGACVRSDDPAANDLISTAIGRPVRLSSIPPRERIVVREWPDIDGMLFRATESAGEIGKAAPGAFFDHAPVHLLTTASLAALTAAAPHADADPLRFRPTLLIQSAENASGFAENDWVGLRISIGDVALKVIAPSPRCVVVTLPHGSLSHNLDVLRGLVAANRIPFEPGAAAMPCIGAYAVVVRTGKVATGDRVILR